MRVAGGQAVLSPSDLVSFAACRHLLDLERAAAVKLVQRPVFADPAFEVLLQRGRDHEERYLAELEAAASADAGHTEAGARTVTRIAVDPTLGLAGVESAARETETAMRRGDAVIHQATFLQSYEDTRWRGHADFLIRVEVPSSLGDWSYEPSDAKLARAAKVGAILQLCAYAEMVARIQERMPEYIRLILGGPGHPEERLRLSDYHAYYRWTRSSFLTALAQGTPAYPPAASYPEPAEKCDTCNWSPVCKKRRVDDDHLSLVAGITRNQRAALADLGVNTVAALARLPIPLQQKPPRTSAEALVRTREQARLQVESRDANKILYELLPQLQADLGLGALPQPSPGDLFFDIEGDPFAFETGLEYLFGIAEPGKPDQAGVPTAYAFWAHDAASEQKAFEDTVDVITRARQRDPALHIFHYNHYEPTALKRLMCKYGTREREVDDLLRQGVFVDLYRVVQQAVRAGVDSYSIKKLEPLYGFTREAELRDAGAARAALEIWLELGATAPLPDEVREKVRVYNLDDCLSAWRLRDWLEGRRAELAAQTGGEVPRPTLPADPALDKVLEKDEAVAALANRLRGVGDTASALLGNLLDYHRREEKSAWWEFFHRCELSDDGMIEDKTCLGGLELIGQPAPPPGARSNFYAFSFPPQEHDLEEGSELYDPRSPPEEGKGGKRRFGTVVEIDDLKRQIVVSRGKKSGPPPAVKSVVPRKILTAKEMAASLLRVGTAVADGGIDTDGSLRAVRDLLLRRAPRIKPPAPGPLVQSGETAAQAALRLVAALDAGVLAIQGPPGSGKTYGGAEMALALVRAGFKVGVTANSHKVIGNFVTRMCSLAAETGRRVAVVHAASEQDQVPDHPDIRWIKSADVAAALQDPQVNVAAGVAWLWSREDMASSVEVLFVDEASQYSLANAIAVSPAARSLVLLGDPQQLDQPIHGQHPPGAEASVLGHLLADEKTIPPDQGLFIPQTRRLHPTLCAFTSELFYEGKLSCIPGLDQQRLQGPAGLDGTGLRVIPVPHTGNQSQSDEEVAEVQRVFASLIGSASWTDAKGTTHKIGIDDVLVISPYNAQVAALKAALPSGARVGTVDKFQGQEAPVVIYSMATSTAMEAPRGMPFLYNPNRLNVATSRARCLAIVIASPDLFRVSCQTPEQMRLANAFCRLREVG